MKPVPSLIEIQQYWDAHVCGTQVTQAPADSPEFFDDIETYHDRFYANALSSGLPDLASLQGSSVLEVGCGMGLDLAKVAAGGARVTGLDLSPRSITLARRYFRHSNLQGQFVVGDAENLSFPDGEFEIVISLGVLHHTPNTQRAIDEIWRVLKPGGRTIVMLYHKFSWYAFLARISKTKIEDEAEDPPVVSMFSVAQVRRMFGRFSMQTLETDRLPTATAKRTGALAKLYNALLVPASRVVPRAIMSRLGFHIIVRASK